MKKRRVIFYIDGLNLYYGLRDAFSRKYLWLDIQKLAESLCDLNEQPIEINYFTCKVSEPADKLRRQSLYIQAIETLPKVKIHYGKYLKNDIICPNCGSKYAKYHEKMSDVNVSVQMILDAYKNRYDIADLISGDSDLVPIISAIKEMFPSKTVKVYFPPRRQSSDLKRVSDYSGPIFEKKFRDCQFPNKMKNTYNFMIERPHFWK